MPLAAKAAGDRCGPWHGLWSVLCSLDFGEEACLMAGAFFSHGLQAVFRTVTSLLMESLAPVPMKWSQGHSFHCCFYLYIFITAMHVEKKKVEFPLPQYIGFVFHLHNPGQHLWVSPSLLSLVVPGVLSSFWHSASSFQQSLLFCPDGHTNFGGCQWEPASVVWHVDSYSLTPAPFEERGLLDSGEPWLSLLVQLEKTP